MRPGRALLTGPGGFPPVPFPRFPPDFTCRYRRNKARRPHIHESACELLISETGRRLLRNSRFDQETRIRKRNRLRWTVPAAAGPRNPRARLRAVARRRRSCWGSPGCWSRRWSTPDGQTPGGGDHRPGLRSRARAARSAARRPRGSRSVPGPRPATCYLGDRQVLLGWRKTRWHCDTPGCEQEDFHRVAARRQARARLTSRLRTRLGEAVGDDLMPAAAAARRYGVSDRTAARAFTAYADEQLADLDERQDPVQAAGVDEFRRGIPAHRRPGDRRSHPARSEWLTHLVDLGTGGTLGLAEGRTADRREGPARRARRDAAVPGDGPVRHLPLRRPRRRDPRRRRLSPGKTRQQEDRRGVPAAGLPHPARARGDSACPARCTTCSATTSRTWTRTTWPPSSACWTPTRDGQQIAAVWIAKEHLRDLLALRATRTHVTPAPSAVRDKLASFYIWCADNDSVPEIKTLAKTIGKWQQPVIDAVLTGYSNAKAEAHNRTAKLVARNARGFANPQNQARRVRMATTRAARHASRTAPQRLTDGSQERGSGQGAVADGDAQDGPGHGTAIGGTPVKYGDPTRRGSSGACLWSMRWVPSWAFACLSELGVQPGAVVPGDVSTIARLDIHASLDSGECPHMPR